MAATLPVAPLTAIAYLLSEWVFFVTKPSPLAGLPLTTELAVLLRSPLNILLPLLCVQAIVSVASGLGSPHLRWLAIVPGAMVGGVLLLQLIDNFTYTLFGFGVLTVGLSFRLIYAALLFALVACAGWTLAGWAAYVAARRHASMMALGLTALLTLVPVVEAPSVAVPADLNAPPASVPIAGGDPIIRTSSFSDWTAWMLLCCPRTATHDRPRHFSKSFAIRAFFSKTPLPTSAARMGPSSHCSRAAYRLQLM